MLILGLLIAALVLFVVDTVLSKSLVSAGLACAALAAVVAHGAL
jgi:hypothetical protein